MFTAVRVTPMVAVSGRSEIMADESVNSLNQRLQDMLVYNSYYAPDRYPDEGVDVAGEFSLMSQLYDEIEDATRDKNKLQRIGRSRREFEEARSELEAGEVEAGQDRLQEAQLQLREARSGEPESPAFVVSPDGEATRED